MSIRRRKSRAKGRRKTLKTSQGCHAFNKISPETLLNLMGSKGIAIVNVLDKDVVINTTPPVTHCCYGSSFIDKNCAQLKAFKTIVLYCANDTCSASHTYANKLLSKCSKLQGKIVLYAGGVYEWALLSFAYPGTYSFYSLKNKAPLDRRQVEAYFSRMAHRKESANNSTYPKVILEHGSRTPRSIQDRNGRSCAGTDTLHGKVCVVTGGTSGLGLEVVRKMLDSGARHVTLTYFHNKKRADHVKSSLTSTYASGRFQVVRADARTEAGNKLVFDRDIRRTKLGINIGPIDCVDINAGIFGPANMHKKHIFNISVKDYDETMDTNLTGYFLALKYFSMQALKHKVKDAAAVCIKSIYGSTGSLFSNIAYQTSKHGVMGLVRQAAIELARPNPQLKITFPIRVNAVSPTFTTTALTKPFLDKSVIHNTIRADNPTNQLAKPEDVANAVVFLLSDAAHSITGIDLPVDCGVLAESVPTYQQVEKLNKAGIEELSCCGNDIS